MTTFAILNVDALLADAPIPSLEREGDVEVWSLYNKQHKYGGILVSSHGRLWSLSQRRLLSSSTKEGWYKMIGMPNGKNQLVHRLVAFAFVPGYFEGAVVNHKDGVKANNFWRNLEWVTTAENNRHAFRLGLNPMKLSDEEVAHIREEANSTARKFSDIGADHSVSGVHIAGLLTGAYRAQTPMNLDHRPRKGKLAKDAVLKVIAALQARQKTYKQIAQEFGVSESNIANIAAGRVWSQLTAGMDLTAGRDTWEMREKQGTARGFKHKSK